MLRKIVAALFGVALVLGGFSLVRATIEVGKDGGSYEGDVALSLYGSRTSYVSAGSIDTVSTRAGDAVDVARGVGQWGQAMGLLGLFTLIRGRAGAGIGALTAGWMWQAIRRMETTLTDRLSDLGSGVEVLVGRTFAYWTVTAVLITAWTFSAYRFLHLFRRGAGELRSRPGERLEPQLD